MRFGRQIMLGNNRDFELDVFNNHRAKQVEKSKIYQSQWGKRALPQPMSSEDSILFALKSCRIDLAGNIGFCIQCGD